MWGFHANTAGLERALTIMVILDAGELASRRLLLLSSLVNMPYDKKNKIYKPTPQHQATPLPLLSQSEFVSLQP